MVRWERLGCSIGGDGWGGEEKRVSNTTRRVDQDDPESGKGLRNGSVRSSTGLVCARVFLRGLPFFGVALEIWIGPQSVKAEVPTSGHTT